MINTSILSLQKALYTILKEDIELSKKVNGVFDYVDEKSRMPIVTIGECYVMPYSTDADNMNGEEVTQEIHVWSQYKGQKECREIIGLILKATTKNLVKIEQTLGEIDFDVDFINREGIEVFDDEDGKTKHGVVKLNFKVTQ